MATTITANGINFPDGSAGSPSIGGTDTNTGLFTGSDIVGFATGGSERLRIDASGNVNIANDSGKLQLGTSADLQIYHSGSHSHITDAGTGGLKIRGSQIILDDSNGDVMIQADQDGSVDLYYNGSKKFETTSVGVKLLGSGTDAIEMTGDVWFNNNEHAGKDIYFNSGDKHLIFEDTVKAKFGSAGDMAIFHDGSHSYIEGYNTGSLIIGTTHDAPIFFPTNNTNRAKLTEAGHFIPVANNTYDLGTSSERWRNVYTNDLNLSNEGSSNDVDGTWGSYTIQEGAEDLFLVNKRNGKKYKFNLTEVS